MARIGTLTLLIGVCYGQSCFSDLSCDNYGSGGYGAQYCGRDGYCKSCKSDICNCGGGGNNPNGGYSCLDHPSSNTYPMSGLWPSQCTSCSQRNAPCTSHSQCGTSQFCSNYLTSSYWCQDCTQGCSSYSGCDTFFTKSITSTKPAQCYMSCTGCSSTYDDDVNAGHVSVGSSIIALFVALPFLISAGGVCLCFWCGYACFSAGQPQYHGGATIVTTQGMGPTPLYAMQNQQPGQMQYCANPQAPYSQMPADGRASPPVVGQPMYAQPNPYGQQPPVQQGGYNPYAQPQMAANPQATPPQGSIPDVQKPVQ